LLVLWGVSIGANYEKQLLTLLEFLDNVLSVNEYPISEIRDNCMNVRRIGLGIMGLHDMPSAMGIKYSSNTALNFIDDGLMNFIKGSV